MNFLSLDLNIQVMTRVNDCYLSRCSMVYENVSVKRTKFGTPCLNNKKPFATLLSM